MVIVFQGQVKMCFPSMSSAVELKSVKDIKSEFGGLAQS